MLLFSIHIPVIHTKDIIKTTYIGFTINPSPRLYLNLNLDNFDNSNETQFFKLEYRCHLIVIFKATH